MAFWNKIVPVNQKWAWPNEDIERIQVNSKTDAEGSIVLEYDNITQVNTSAVEIFLVTLPMVPATQYVRSGIDLNTGTQFGLTSFLLSSGRIQLDWKFNTNQVVGVADGNSYIVSIDINEIVDIEFLVKIVDIEV